VSALIVGAQLAKLRASSRCGGSIGGCWGCRQCDWKAHVEARAEEWLEEQALAAGSRPVDEGMRERATRVSPEGGG
jgi:hypothetical protein